MILYTHTHTHTSIFYKRIINHFKKAESINKKENSKETKVLKLNLSATMGVAGVIVFVIIAIITAQIIATAISSNSQKAMAEEETQGYTMVDSTDVDEEGNVIDVQVPVPDGFTASQVPGETTVNGGFVIYEGEVDWSKIEDLDSYAEVEATAEEIETQTEDASTENSNTDSSSSENSEEVSTESNKEDATSNSDRTTTNENNIEEVAEEQTQDANSEQVDLTENSQENAISEEKEIVQNQIDEENTQEEEIDREQIDNTEENSEELEQANNEEINEEEPITNEEAEVATIAEEEENEGIETISEEDAGIATIAEGETPTTVFELQTSVNQYVWVPVKDVSRIYGVDSNGKLWGKLYNYSSTGRSKNNWSENSTSGVMSITNKTGNIAVVSGFKSKNINRRDNRLYTNK